MSIKSQDNIAEIYDSIEKYITKISEDIKNQLKSLNGHKVRNQFYYCEEPFKPAQIRNISPVHLKQIALAIEKYLSVICSTPKKRKDFIKSYVFPDIMNPNINDFDRDSIADYSIQANFEAALQNCFSVGCNASQQCIEILVKMLCDLANKEKKERSTKFIEKVLFLTGGIGEGKTMFLNYMLSVFNWFFVKKRIITIKLDYTSFKEQGTKGLENKIAHKCLRILKEHYFRRKRYKNYIDPSTSVCNEKNFLVFLTKEGCSEKIRNAAESYFSQSSERLDDESRVALFEYLKIYFTTHKEPCSFLFIIDGLDNFYRDIDSDKLFVERCNELVQYLEGPRLTDSCYLIVMRNESFNFLRTTKNGFSVVNKIKSIRLFPVNIDNVLDAKFKLIKERLAQDYEIFEKNDQEQDIKRQRTDELIDKFKVFLINFINNSFNDERQKSDGYVLCKLFNNNNRWIVDATKAIAIDLLVLIENQKYMYQGSEASAARQCLYDIVTGVIDSERFMNKKYYVAHRALMLNKLFFCLDRFYISMLSSDSHNIGKVYSNNLGPKANSYHNEASFIASIFSFTNPLDFIEKSGQFNQHYLVNLRILQYYKFLKESKLSASPNSAAKYLSKTFGYLAPIVKQECKLLHSTLCLEKIMFLQADENKKIDEFEMKIATLGEFILDNLCYSYSYYENVIDSAKAPDFITKNYLYPPITLAITNYTGSQEEQKKFENKFLQKIIKVLVFINYLERVENLEKQFFLRKPGVKYFSFDHSSSNDDLAIFNKVKKIIYNRVARIINNMPQSLFSEFQKQIST